MASLPTHEAGDLLVAFFAGDSAPSITSGWTSLGSASTTWAFDGYAAAYRIADSSSTPAPFSGGGQRNIRFYSITGHDANNPIAGSSVSAGGGFGTWTGARIIGAVGAPSLVGSANAGAVFFPPGFNDYFFGTSNDFTLGTDDFTAECFFKQQVTTGIQTLLEVGSANQLRLIVINGTEIQASFGTGGVGLNANGWTVPGWNHVAVTRAGGTSRLFINGTWVFGNPNTASISLSGNGIRIGANFNTSNYYQGHISNLRVVKGTAVYPDSSNIAVPTEPLTAISGTAVLCCNDPGNVNASTGATVAQGSSFVSPSRDTPFTSQGTDGLRLTMLTGYGGGGNGWNTSGAGHVWGVPGLTRAFSDTYVLFLEGGTSNPLRVLFQQGYSGGSLAFASVGIREAAQSSGFFQFF